MFCKLFGEKMDSELKMLLGFATSAFVGIIAVGSMTLPRKNVLLN